MPIVAVSAVFVGLFLTGIDLNITALMGLTMVVGIVTEVAIFYFSEFERLKNEGVPLERALVSAAQNRLRPIAMTTIAAAIALLPLALALGQGAEMQQPLAIAIISGLAVADAACLADNAGHFFRLSSVSVARRPHRPGFLLRDS